MNKSPEIVAKYYVFLKWAMLHIEKLPKNQRYVFGKYFEDKLLNILENLLRAYYQKDKIAILQQANIDLDVVRYFLRLSIDLKLLTVKQYEFAINALLEIGRQLGGWIKATHPQPLS